MSDCVPIHLANPRPFRLVIRDKCDVWRPTLDEINRSAYNYIKLHSATRFIYVDTPEPYPICVGYDGSYILPAIKRYNTLEATLDAFNRIFASILIGGIYIECVDPEDLSHGEMTEFGYYRHKQTYGGNGELHRALGIRGASAIDAVRLIEAPTILADDIESAYSRGATVLKNIENLSPSLLITSFTYFLKRQTKEALSHTWICSEQILDHIWRLLVVNDAKRSQIGHRRKFLESQQWSAAHKIELLHQKSVLSKNKAVSKKGFVNV